MCERVRRQMATTDLKARLLNARSRRVSASDSRGGRRHGVEPPLESLIDGEWVTSSGCRCFVTERLYALDHEHGRQRLSEALTLPVEEWQPFAGRGNGRPFDLRQAAFIDTETTGLARGAGTYLFLVGVGVFKEQGFRIRQYFMPDYGDEEAMLDLLASDLASCQGLVSFNGRSFDWPIIEARYVLARREPPCEAEPHLDLLPLSRGLWRRVLSSCALSSLESTLLGIERSSTDVPGYLVPQLYRDYVRWGRTRPIVRVLYHNEIDVLSLVALAGRIGRLLGVPADLEDSYCDYLALGRLCERSGRTERAMRAYRIAGERGGRWDAAVARKHLSFLFKRLGRHDEAMAIWRGALGGGEIYPYVELAKQLEHRLRNYGEARRVVLQAMALLRGRRAGVARSRSERLMAELEHRLARVERRLCRERALRA